MFFKEPLQLDRMGAGSPDVKDIVSKVQFPTRPNPKQADEVFSYLSLPQLAPVSANQAVIATVQQYETVRGILSLANLELAREQPPPEVKDVEVTVNPAGSANHLDNGTKPSEPPVPQKPDRQ